MNAQTEADLREELAEYKWISKELAKSLGCGCTVGGEFLDLCINCKETQQAYKSILKTYENECLQQNSPSR
jgi:translation initiation factor 1 (eIF-1/SUI1)